MGFGLHKCPGKRVELISKTEEDVIAHDLKYINSYLEESISNGGLYWGGDPANEVFLPGLSNYY